MTEKKLAGSGQALQPLPEPTPRSDAVVETIRGAILDGSLHAGELLVERRLAAQLGVSKTPVREALIALSRSGLVTYNPHHGSAVRSVDSELVRSVYEVRRLVEPHAIRQALPEHGAQSLEVARATLRQSVEAGEREDWVGLSRITRRFHRLLYARCRNDLLFSILDGLQDQVALCAVSLWRERPTWRDEAHEHEAILAAMAAANAELTEQHVRAHIDQSVARLIRTLEAART